MLFRSPCGDKSCRPHPSSPKCRSGRCRKYRPLPAHRLAHRTTSYCANNPAWPSDCSAYQALSNPSGKKTPTSKIVKSLIVKIGFSSCYIILSDIVHPFRSNLTPEFIEENTRVIFFLYGKSHLSQFVQFLPGNAFGYLFYKIL